MVEGRQHRILGESWTGPAAVALVGLLSLAAGSRRIWATDFWWQMATGAWIRENGWPHGDPFSFTARGAEWIELRWIFCRLQEAVYGSLGPAPLVWGKWAILAASFLLMATADGRPRRWVAASWVVAIALLASSPRFFVRPELSTYLFIALFVFLLRRSWRRDGRLWLLLPLLQAVWVNLHPLFFFGPLLIGLAGLAEAWRAWRDAGELSSTARRLLGSLGVVFALCVAACLLNPYGYHALLFPLELFAEIRDSAVQGAITELQSPFAFAGQDAFPYLILLIAMSAVTAIGAGRKVDAFWLLLAVSQLYLALTSVRSVPLFALAAVPLVLSAGRQLMLRLPQIDTARLERWARVGLTLLALFVAVHVWRFTTDRAYVRQGDSNQFGWRLADDRYPLEGVAFLTEAGVEGPVFGSLIANNVLLSRGFSVFVDTRTEVYGDVWFERYLAASTQREAFVREAQAFGFVAAVVDPASPAARNLWGLSGWRLVHVDTTSAVFLADGVAPQVPALDGAALDARLDALIAQLGERPERDEVPLFGRVRSPRPLLTVADFAFLSGRHERSARLIRRAEALAPFLDGLADKRRAAEAAAARAATGGGSAGATAALEQAQAQLQSGDLAGAQATLAIRLREAPEDHAAWALLGSVYLRAGRLDEAGEATARAMELSPTWYYRVQLADVAVSLGMIDRAIAGLEIAAQSSPESPAIHARLARLYLRQGDVERARAALERGEALAPGEPVWDDIRADLRPAGDS